MKANIKYKFLEKNTPNSLQKIDIESKTKDKPFFNYESEKNIIQQKISIKPNILSEEKKDKDSLKPVKLSKHSNLQFSQKQEIYEKEKGNDDSFDDLFLKTLEKNDLDYLKQSLLKFNLKESINDTISSKKYNNIYLDDFEQDEGDIIKDDIPELIETNNLGTYNTNNFSFNQTQLKKTQPNENPIKISTKDNSNNKERTYCAKEPTLDNNNIKKIQITEKNTNLEDNLRKSTENFKIETNINRNSKNNMTPTNSIQNTTSNLTNHISPKICKTTFSEKFAINKKDPIKSKPNNEKSRNLEKIVKKIEKLDENKRNQLEKLLDKIEEGSLDLESFIKFDLFAKPPPINKPKIQIIENYQPFTDLPKENLLIIKILSSWNGGNLAGLTEIQLYDKNNKIIVISMNNINIKNASNGKNLKNLINGIYETTDENQMWVCNLPQLPLLLELHLSFHKEKDIAGMKIWNYNKNSMEVSKGVKDCEIFINNEFKWKGIIKQGFGIETNKDYSQEIIFLEGFEFFHKKSNQTQEKPSALSQTKNADINKVVRKSSNNYEFTKLIEENKKIIRKQSTNFESEPNLNIKKNIEIQAIRDKINMENDLYNNKISDSKKNEIDNMNKSLKFHPKTPLIFDDKTPQKKIPIPFYHSVDEIPIQNIQNIEILTKEPPNNKDPSSNNDQHKSLKKIGNRFENNKEFLENYSPKSKFFEIETELPSKKLEVVETVLKQTANEFNPLDTLKYFNLNNEARLIKPPSLTNPENNLTKSKDLKDFQDDINALDSFFLKGSKSIKNNLLDDEKTFLEPEFIIPTLPSGRYFKIVIYTTWGDPHYVGLSGLELFDSKGEIIRLKSNNQIQASPADINILPEYSQDPRTIDKLMDGVYMTCDDLHVWLAPFTKGKENFIEIDLGETHKISLIRIWNYNKSRIHSFRGAKDIRIAFDNKTIFQGEIKKAPGTLKNSEKFCEYIMFTGDEKTINNIERRDWLNSQLRYNPKLDEEVNELLDLYERPTTATKYFDEKAVNEIQGMLKIVELNQNLLGTDGRPITLANFSHNIPHEKVNNNEMVGNINKNKIQEKKFIKAKNIVLNLLDSWGDKFYIGLSGLEIYDSNSQKINLNPKYLNANPRDLNSTPGFEGDPRVLENLLNRENITTNDKKMWLIPFVKGHEHTIFINFPYETSISGLQFWNYNKSIDDLNRGVKLISIKADGNYVTPKEGIVLKKSIGNELFDYGQIIPLPYNENLEEKRIVISDTKSVVQNPQKKIIQQYETPNLPMGFILKFVLLSTWGDLNYIGLNGLEIYDGNAEPLLYTGRKEFKIVGDPSSINILKGSEKDIRTIDKLINGKNCTYDDRNMWLSPYLYNKSKEKTNKEKNVIYISFLTPVVISNINFWNYTKTLKRGVKDIEIYLDENLIYKGVIRKAPTEENYIQGKEIVTSILFTKNNDLIQKLKPAVYNNDDNENYYSLINEKKILKYGLSEEMNKEKKTNSMERPITGVRGNM